MATGQLGYDPLPNPASSLNPPRPAFLQFGRPEACTTKESFEEFCFQVLLASRFWVRFANSRPCKYSLGDGVAPPALLR